MGSAANETIPLVSIQTMQPNFYCIRDATETIERLSVYNLTIKMHNPKMWEQTSVEFGDVIFDTHQGELDETGISPALFELQRITNRNDNKDDIKVMCNLRRPIQIKLTPTSVENLFSLKETINHVIYGNGQPNVKCDRAIYHLNNIKEIRKLTGGPSSIEFNMTKISINFMTSLDRVVSLALFKWNNKIDVRERLKQITYATSIETVSINTQNSMLLHPTSMAFECMLSQEKWSKRLVISTNFTSNVIQFQINPNDFWTFAKVQLDFWSCLNRCVNTSTEVKTELTEPSKSLNPDNLTLYQLPRATTSNSRANEEYFQDDLRLVSNWMQSNFMRDLVIFFVVFLLFFRLGTFEYIIANGENALPSPYQIYLLNSGADMQICWRYPHPRMINFIQIYPIPGQVSIFKTIPNAWHAKSVIVPRVSILFLRGHDFIDDRIVPQPKI